MKQVFKWMLAAGLTVSMAITSLAATKLPAPTGIRWGTTPGEARWDIVPAAEGEYQTYVYRNGKEFSETHWVRKQEGVEHFYYDIYESGSYTFRVQALGDGKNTTDSDLSVLSAPYEYVKPAISFGEVKNLKWSEDNPSVAVWQAPDRSAAYAKHLKYKVIVYIDDVEVGSTWGFTGEEMDMRDWMTEEAQYRFSVQAISSNIEVISHGKTVFSDDTVDVPGKNEEISGKLDDLLGYATASNALKELEKENITDIALGMQTSEDIRSQISELEDRFLSEKNATVKKNVAENVPMNPDDIHLVGAGLNLASSSNAVEFRVKKPDREANVDSSLYKNTFQVDLSLGGAVDQLKVPITITMPVPEGIKLSRLTILHHKKNGEFETILGKVDADKRTVTFTVTDFSIFVFAEQVESGNNSGNQTGSGGGGSGRVAPIGNTPGSWVMGEQGWQFYKTDGSLVTSSWVRSNELWYWVDDKGVMATGWIWWNNNWYYLNPNQEGLWGAMTTGWLYDQNYQSWFYLDPQGMMVDGWQQVNGVWYYFYPDQQGNRGKMAVSTVIDGYQLGADGAWIQ